MTYAEIREERRRDRQAAAEERRRDQRATEQAARRARQERDQRKAARRARRQRAAQAAWTWVSTNALDLSMLVIVIVPGLLAWTAMSVYGAGIYGPPGLLLPLFSEMAMWVFSFAIQRNRRAGRPVWMLGIGLAATTAAAGLLNYIHGAETAPHVGAVMALVSVSGVLVHQVLLHADRERRARRTRAQRIAARRVRRMERAAARSAVGQLDADGTVRLVIEPGTVTLDRLGRLSRTPVPGIGEDGPSEPLPGVAEEAEAWLRTRPEPPRDTPSGESGDTASDQARDRGQDTPVPAGEDRGVLTLEDTPEDTPRDTPRAAPDSNGRWTWEALLAAFRTAVQQRQIDPTSQRNVRLTLGCSRDRARQLVQLYAAENTRN